MKIENYQEISNLEKSRIFPKLITYEDQFPEIDSGDEVISSKKSFNLFVSSPKILLVEDNPILQTVHMDMLSLLGCSVELAEDGYEAISMSKNNYDIIFMDIGLPKLNGIKATQIIRSQEPSHHRNIIIAVSAYGEAVENECREVGINDFYTKPVLLDSFVSILKYWLPHLLRTNNMH